MATISDIAKASGVSTAAVSYVLNNRAGSVSAETRERVLSVMRELNYRPSPLFMRKHAAKAEAIGVTFMHNGMTSLTDHPWMTLLMDGILSVTTPLAWDLVLLSNSTSNTEDVHKTLRAKCDGRCDGLLLLGFYPDAKLIEVLKSRGIPFVCINMGSSLEGVSSVDIDNEAAAHEMTDHLIGLGHRRIALLSGDANLENTQARERGFKRAMAEAGLEIPAHFLAPGVFTEYSGRDRAQELMILPEAERPTALFCGSDRIAVGALETVHRLGLKVPGEVSIAGFDDVPQALRTEPPLTTIRQPIVDLGKRATEILLGHIDDFTTSSTHVILPAELIVRQSTGSAPEL